MYLKTVVSGRHVHAPCKILSLQQSLFLCLLNFMDNIRLTKMKKEWVTFGGFWGITRFLPVVSMLE